MPRGALTGVCVGLSAWPPATRQCHWRLAWATQALPRGLSAASHLRGGPARHINACNCRSPRQHLQVRTLFFCDFKDQFKNQIKMRKRHKLHKFITLNIQLLFNPNFLHWTTNFFLFNIMSFKIYFQRRNQDELEFT